MENYFNSFKKLLLVALLGVATLPAFALSTTAKYKIAKTSDTPSGAGKIYGYRGGGDGTTSGIYLEGDKLKTGGLSWTNAEDGMDVLDMTIKQSGGSSQNYNPSADAGNRPDGYKQLDRRDGEDGGNTIMALHMYFYAKPNPGYEYMGWYDKEGNSLTGSTDHWPYPQKQTDGPSNSQKTYEAKRWDNGDGSTLPGTGPYSDFFYLRHVELLSKSEATADRTMYVKFQIIPRHFKFVGTGFDDVSYTAAGTTVRKTTVESGNITSNIALNITFEDPAKYNFVKWQWSLGPNGNKTDIATSTSATYTFVVDRGCPTVNYATNPHTYYAYDTVYIWPVLTEVIDAEATVQIGEADPVPYEHWADAFSAAKAENVSGAIVTLKKDISGITTVQTVDRNMTLDLNNHTITGSVNNMFTVTAGEFTLRDNTPAAAGKIVLNISDATTYAVTVNSGAKLIMQSGGVSATNTLESGTSRGVEIKSGGTLEMTGGSIYAQSAKNAYALINRGTATINNGNIQSLAKGTSTKGTGVTSVAFLNTNTNGSGVATINGGTFSAVADSTTAYGIQQYVNTVTINNAIVNATAGKSGACALRRDGGKILVKDGKYKGASVLNTATTSSIELRGGLYSTYGNVRSSMPSGYGCYEIPAGPDWDAGYRFQVVKATDKPRAFKVFAVGYPTSYYETLEDALAYANNNTGVVMSIIMIAFEYTLPAGNYTLPQRADLIVPYSVDQTGVTGATPVRQDSYSTPSLFRKLTFAEGVHLDAFGSIDVGGKQNTSGQGENGCGNPTGAYSQLVLNQGSSITIENNSVLYAWGFITGKGEINVRNGGKVHEQFQMYDWKGGWGSSKMLDNSGKVFPVTQYFIQNIESPVVFHPGSRLTAATAVYINSERVPCDNIGVVGTYGETAMFLMDPADVSEDTWVRKEYDAVNDKQVYKVNSSAQLGSMQLYLDLSKLGALVTAVMGNELDFNSANYILPITNNLKIELLTGSMDVTQSTVMLPGAEIEVDKEATVGIVNGEALYVVDAEQWDKYTYSNAYVQQVRYSPTFGGKPNKRGTITNKTFTFSKPESASILVHGTFDVKGTLYTTESGANIHSTVADAGTVLFSKAAPTTNGSIQFFQSQTGSSSSTEVHYVTYNTPPALLKNEIANPAYSPTASTAKDKSFCYLDIDGTGGRWTMLTNDGCFVKDEATNKYYAKPQDYVELLNGKTENADHTYTSADGTRTLILVEGCQWWEVELEDADKGLWHCTHPLNDVYYYYNGSAWVVKQQTVVWKNFDGTTVATYTNVPYKTTPVYNSSTPSRPMDAYYTYDFENWEPELAPITTDMVYTATYVSKDRKYTIIFKNEDGSVIETDYCTMGQVPVCSKEPSKAGYNLVWSPTIAAVTGDAEYQATFTNVVAASYLITFKNYNSTQTLQSGQVTTGTMPVYSGATPTKPSTEDQQFTWLGWEPALHNVDADAIYVPTFTASPITYAIKWEVNGVITKQETVNKGVTPSYGSIPTKESTDQYTFAFTGWNPAVGPASADVTYVAQFSSTARTYTVTLNTNGGTINAGDVTSYTCGTAAVLPTNVTKDNCVFGGWYDNSGLTGSAVSTIAADAYGNKSYWAKWTLNTHDLSISATPEGYGLVTPSSVPNIPHGEAVTVNGNTFTVNGTTVTATPTAQTAEYTYAFSKWNNVPATITANVANITAEFTRTARSYALTWSTDGDALTGDYTHGSVAYGTSIVAPNTPTKTGYDFAGWSNGTSVVTPAATMPAANTTYTATWTPVNYTIGYTLNGGSVDPANPTSYTIESEAITLTNPTKSGYTFDGWTGTGLESATTTVTIGAGSTGDRSYTATWHIASSDVLEVGETHEKQITINSSETVTTTIVHADGKLNIEYGKTLTTTELILEASESTSGEIIRGENASGEFAGGIDVPSNAYFDLTHTGGFKARTWYAVAVPWEVFVPTGALGGVYLKKGELEPVQQILGTTFDLIFYDGERRAAGENKAWTYIEDYYADHTNKYPVMEPGVAYMIYLTSDADVIRFKKRTNAPCHTDGLQVTEHDSPIKADKHWNGIANPATYHARIDLSAAGVGFGQVYSNPIEQLYSVFDLSEKLVVGQPVFVQVPVTSSVAVSAPSLARRRAKEQVSITRYDLMLAASDADVTDRVIVRMDENKTENEYVIGQDLVKMGVSNKAPQMWIDRYGEKMCVNTVAGFDNTADYPLGIFAPKNGEYDLFIDDQPNDETMLYLTYDGEAIWNLSYGPYVASLEKGTNTHYGLRIAKKAPQITTGIEEATVQNGEAIRKVLVNDKVYIIRNGEIYSVTGQKAK